MVRPIAAVPIRTRSTPEVVQDQLLALIVGGGLTIDDRLPPERELAHQLGISRTTLRDGLRGLEQLGVLESRQGAGWFVRHSTQPLTESLALHFRLQDITFGQLVEARRAIEPVIAALAATRRTEDEMVVIVSCSDEMAHAVDDDHWVQADYRFHAAIARASHNPFFSIAIQPTLTLLTPIRTAVLSRPNSRAKSDREHAAIVRALRSQDATAARSAMLRHIQLWKTRGNDLVSATARSVIDVPGRRPSSPTGGT